jgi:hypothetical protein
MGLMTNLFGESTEHAHRWERSPRGPHCRTCGVYADDAPATHDADTSVEAAAKVKRSGRASKRAAAMTELYRKHPDGLTADEAEVLTGGTHQSVSATVSVLFHRGVLYDTGKRRKTRSGNNARVYAIKQEEWQ